MFLISWNSYKQSKNEYLIIFDLNIKKKKLSRLVKKLDMTGTYKLQKTQLQKEVNSITIY